MKVIVAQQFDYLARLRKLLKHGGPHGRAAQKAIEIQDWLQQDLDLTAQTTNHGESRIRGCVKYDLGHGFRLVTVQRGESVVLLNLGTHAEMQNWLDANDGLEVVMRSDDQRLAFSRPNRPEPWRIQTTAVVTPSNVPFLQRVEGVNWMGLIPSRSVRDFLLKFDEDGDSDALLEVLGEFRGKNPAAAELCLAIISHLKNGEHDAAQAAADVFLGRAKPVPDEDVMTEEVLQAESNQGRFVVLNDLSDAEMERLYDPLRFQDWMLFLHPGQRRVVDEDFPGPALLGGVSGSGKTCVLVHRARELAKRYPDQKILVLTLNRSLARLIENLVRRLCLTGEDSCITVQPFHDYLAEVLAAQDLRHFLEWFGEYLGMEDEVKMFLNQTPEKDWPTFFLAPSATEQLTAFEEFLTDPANPARTEYDRLEVFVFSQDQSLDLRRYLFEELELVRSAFLCYDAYAGYLNYRREGRSIPFAENRREPILSILREWERWQVRRGRLDQMGLAQLALFALDGNANVLEAFRHRAVLVDEFQDFSTLELSLLRRIPNAAENGLFLTGDVAQKIYAKDLNLPAAELGRDRRTDRMIRQNYRNSRQILLAANALIEKFPPQLSDGDDGVSVLNPEYARRETAKPIATQAGDIAAAAWISAREWLAGGHVAFSVCIATANPGVLSVEQLLAVKPEDLEADILTGDYLLTPNHVVVSDIVSVKGFEFSLIIVCGLDAGTYPPRGVPVAEHWRDALRLYVAITRGRDEVRFLYQTTPSPFLEAMGDHVQFQIWEPEVNAPLLGEPAAKEKEEIPEAVACVASAPSELREEPLQIAEQEEPAVTQVLPTGEALEVAEVLPPAAFLPEDEEPAPRETQALPIGPSTQGEDNWPAPEVLNGIPIIAVPHMATEADVALVLGKSQIQISLICQEQGVFVPPNVPLRRHVVKRIFDQFGCVPNFINRKLRHTRSTFGKVGSQ